MAGNHAPPNLDLAAVRRRLKAPASAHPGERIRKTGSVRQEDDTERLSLLPSVALLRPDLALDVLACADAAGTRPVADGERRRPQRRRVAVDGAHVREHPPEGVRL